MDWKIIAFGLAVLVLLLLVNCQCPKQEPFAGIGLGKKVTNNKCPDVCVTCVSNAIDCVNNNFKKNNSNRNAYKTEENKCKQTFETCIESNLKGCLNNCVIPKLK